MGFKFPLATVLRLREIAEEREERLLGQILQQMAQARQALTDLETAWRGLVQQREAALHQRMSAAELHVSYAQMRVVEQRQKAAREHLEKLETLRVQQTKIYELAHRNRELLDGMRDEQREVYLRDRQKLEQNNMDDNFIARRPR